jgi:hypothetical protein
MKTEEKKIDTVKVFREIKKNISEDTKDMEFKEYKEYLKRTG